MIVYINRLRKSRGLIDEIEAYADLQEEPNHAAQAMDPKDYGIGAQILRDLSVHNMVLLSNSPKRRRNVTVFGLNIVDTLSFDMIS